MLNDQSPRPIGADEEDSEKKAEDEKAAFSPVAKRLFDSRQLSVFGAIDQEHAHKICAQLLALEQADPDAPITMILNSPGGSVTDGFAIYDMMRFIQPEVRVVCTGLAASIATVILLAAPKGQRLAMPNTKLLIHQVYLGAVVRGQASDLEITARDLLQTRNHINELLAQETGQDLARIEHDTNRDYWMTAEAAVEYGLIDRIVTSRADLS